MRSAGGLHAELIAQLADDADRKLVLVLGLARLVEIGVSTRLDLTTGLAFPARIESGFRPRLAQKCLGELASEGAFADPFGSHEQERVRKTPLAGRASQRFHDPVMTPQGMPRHVSLAEKGPARPRAESV